MPRTPFFVAVDGEAIDGKYCLIQDSQGGELYRRRGLGTKEIFRWFFGRMDALETEIQKPVFIGFGTSYDCNQFMRDIDEETLSQILQTEEKEFVSWEEYQILYFPRKLMRLKREGKELVFYDVYTFFGSSFVRALSGFLGDRFDGRRLIETGKAGRATFTHADLSIVRRYNSQECKLLVSLAEKLQEILTRQGIELTKWHGPGAVADYILGTKGYRVHEDYPVLNDRNTPTGLYHAWDCAYYGGRIESFILGSASQVYTYDINSAYPKAASLLPILFRSEGWEHTKKPRRGDGISCSVCRVRWNLTSERERCYIGPFPWRDSTGRIFFPSSGEGWYWLPEVQAARRMYGEKIEILETWSQQDYTLGKLSSVIPSLYDKRMQLKRSSDPSEYALKIALNSMYGKFAQRSGKRPYFCLPYAGFITSYTRGMLLDAVSQNPHQILSFATDSVTSRVPLKLSLGNALGEWKEERYKKYLCIMNGFYRLDAETHKSKSATRGVPSTFEWEDLIEQLNAKGTVTFKQRVFITLSLAMHQHEKWKGKRLTFQDDEKTLDPFTAGKRIFSKQKLTDWEHDYTDSVPPAMEGISNPSSLSFAPESLKERSEMYAETEAEEEEETQ